MRRHLPFLITILLAAVLSGLAATYAVEAVERRSVHDVRTALDEVGLDWAEVSADGLRIDLSGTAPDEATHFRAISAAGSAVDSARVVDRIDIATREGIAPPTFSIELLRQSGSVTLIGLVPEESDRRSLVREVGRNASGTPVTDLLETARYPAPQGWGAAVEFGLEALGRLDRAKVSISAGKVEITALAPSEKARDKLARDLRRMTPSGVTLALDLAAPRPVIAPFILRVVKEEGTAHFDACSAASEEGAAQILDVARQAGMAGTDAGTCRLGLGVPSPEWAATAASALTRLGAFETATLTMSDLDITLEAGAGTDAEAFGKTVAALETSLPPEFALTARIDEGPTVDPEAGPAEFRATRSAEGQVRLGGRLGDERSASAVESFAKALFGMEAVAAEIDVAGPVPTGWGPRVLASLDALSILHSGEVRVGEEDIRISGVSGVESATQEISRILSAPSGVTPRFDIDVGYDAAVDAEEEMPTPQDCVDRVNAVLAERQITFAPGSATIDTEARGSVDGIADILRNCDGIAMEVAGYTDSQGGEDMNRSLSKSRAEAVLMALSARRVVTSDLVAEGYGEDDPIADNETAEGREANRRIAFRLIEAADPDAAEENYEGADATEEEGAE